METASKRLSSRSLTQLVSGAEGNLRVSISGFLISFCPFIVAAGFYLQPEVEIANDFAMVMEVSSMIGGIDMFGENPR